MARTGEGAAESLKSCDDARFGGPTKRLQETVGRVVFERKVEATLQRELQSLSGEHRPPDGNASSNVSLSGFYCRVYCWGEQMTIVRIDLNISTVMFDIYAQRLRTSV